MYSKRHTKIYKDNLLYTGVFLARTQTHRAVGRYSHQARFAAALSRKLAVIKSEWSDIKSASVTHKSLVIIHNQTITLHAGKVKQSRYRPRLAQRVPGCLGSQISWQRHRMVVMLSALGTGRLYPQEMFQVFISVRGWVDPRVRVHAEGLCQWKIPMTPAGIEPATFRFVAQHLNHCATAVPS